MKSFLLFSVLFAFSWSFAQKKKLTPYQETLKSCVDSKIDVSKLNTNKEVYKAINLFYPLVSSDTLYREVEFRQKGENKKLKLEFGRIKIYAVSDDDSLALLSSEDVGVSNLDNDMQHKPMTADARLTQLLFRTDIYDDYSRLKEQRAKQVAVLVEWANSQVKTLEVSFPAEKKTLSCQQKEGRDICSCKN